MNALPGTQKEPTIVSKAMMVIFGFCSCLFTLLILILIIDYWLDTGLRGSLFERTFYEACIEGKLGTIQFEEEECRCGAKEIDQRFTDEDKDGLILLVENPGDSFVALEVIVNTDVLPKLIEVGLVCERKEREANAPVIQR